MSSRRGQSSFEFLAIMGVLFLVVMGAFGFVQNRMYSVVKEKNDETMEGVANIIRSEFSLAASINGDYYRKFSLPQTVDGLNYTISLKGGSDVVISVEESNNVIFLNQNVTGTIVKGENYIKKVNGNISVNV